MARRVRGLRWRHRRRIPARKDRMGSYGSLGGFLGSVRRPDSCRGHERSRTRTAAGSASCSAFACARPALPLVHHTRQQVWTRTLSAARLDVTLGGVCVLRRSIHAAAPIRLRPLFHCSSLWFTGSSCSPERKRNGDRGSVGTRVHLVASKGKAHLDLCVAQVGYSMTISRLAGFFFCAVGVYRFLLMRECECVTRWAFLF